MTDLSEIDERLCETSQRDFSDTRALFVNCTLKRSPEASNTQGLAETSIAVMHEQASRSTSSAPSTATSPRASGRTCASTAGSRTTGPRSTTK